MTTKTTVSINTELGLPIRQFSDFERGETLLPLTRDGRPNGAVGLKLDPHTILWLCTADGSTTGHCTETVKPTNRYAVPSSVDIKVTL